MTTDNKLETGGPAYPRVDGTSLNRAGYQSFVCTDGMSIRTYAAIHLRVPQSEHDWLNKMIRESQRFELAKVAMEQMDWGKHPIKQCSEDCYLAADTMLAEQEKK